MIYDFPKYEFDSFFITNLFFGWFFTIFFTNVILHQVQNVWMFVKSWAVLFAPLTLWHLNKKAIVKVKISPEMPLRKPGAYQCLIKCHTPVLCETVTFVPVTSMSHMACIFTLHQLWAKCHTHTHPIGRGKGCFYSLTVQGCLREYANNCCKQCFFSQQEPQ